MADNNNNNKNIEVLIEELIKLTKENKIQWKYTNDNREILVRHNKIFEEAYDFTDNCFYTKINNGYIMMTEETGEPVKNYLTILPSIDSKDFKIYRSPQNQIVRLNSLILRQFPNVEDYLTDVFKTLKTMST